jgi:hypothetical protein
MAKKTKKTKTTKEKLDGLAITFDGEVYITDTHKGKTEKTLLDGEVVLRILRLFVEESIEAFCRKCELEELEAEKPHKDEAVQKVARYHNIKPQTKPKTPRSKP